MLTAVRLHFAVPASDQPRFDSLFSDLVEATQPSGILETIAFERLIMAAWNVDRFRRLEAGLFAQSDNQDPYTDLNTMARAQLFTRLSQQFQNSYDRALKELARLQTNRALRDPDSTDLPPLADRSKLASFRGHDETAEIRTLQRGIAEFDLSARQMIMGKYRKVEQNQIPAKQTQSEPAPALQPAPAAQIARNAPCPCGSGDKYKRCCGRHAAPVLGNSAA